MTDPARLAPTAAPWLAVKEIRAAAFDTALTGPKIELPPHRNHRAVARARRATAMASMWRGAFAPGHAGTRRRGQTPPPTDLANGSATAQSALLVLRSVVAASRSPIALAKPVNRRARRHRRQHRSHRTERRGWRQAAHRHSPRHAAKRRRACRRRPATICASSRARLISASIAWRWRPSPLSQQQHAAIARHGWASLSGKLALNNAATASKTGESLRFAGRASDPRAEAHRSIDAADVCAMGRAVVAGLELATGAGGTRVELADLLLDQPRGDIVIGEDGSLNLTQIGKTSAPATPQRPSSDPAARTAPAVPRQHQQQPHRPQVAMPPPG